MSKTPEQRARLKAMEKLWAPSEASLRIVRCDHAPAPDAIPGECPVCGPVFTLDLGATLTGDDSV
jgi:hypothetical protein